MIMTIKSIGYERCWKREVLYGRGVFDSTGVKSKPHAGSANVGYQ
jgi:hypothetical protein